MSAYKESRNMRYNSTIKSHKNFDKMPNFSKHYSSPIEDKVLAMAYVKPQKWSGALDCGAGLSKGTIFSELEKPFLGQGGYPR